jgi:hypothetical protein
MFDFLKFFKIIGGPFCLFLAWWILDVISPALKPELQFSLTDKGWGEFFGFIGSGFIALSCVESCKEIMSLFKKSA